MIMKTRIQPALIDAGVAELKGNKFTANTKEWRVTYQNTPFNCTIPHALLIEADTPEKAFVTAHRHLTQLGLAVHTYTPTTYNGVKLKRAKIEFALKSLAGVGCNRTFITSVAAYRAPRAGRVIGSVA